MDKEKIKKMLFDASNDIKLDLKKNYRQVVSQYETYFGSNLFPYYIRAVAMAWAVLNMPVTLLQKLKPPFNMIGNIIYTGWQRTNMLWLKLANPATFVLIGLSVVSLVRNCIPTTFRVLIDTIAKYCGKFFDMLKSGEEKVKHIQNMSLTESERIYLEESIWEDIKQKAAGVLSGAKGIATSLGNKLLDMVGAVLRDLVKPIASCIQKSDKANMGAMVSAKMIGYSEKFAGSVTYGGRFLYLGLRYIGGICLAFSAAVFLSLVTMVSEIFFSFRDLVRAFPPKMQNTNDIPDNVVVKPTQQAASLLDGDLCLV